MAIYYFSRTSILLENDYLGKLQHLYEILEVGKPLAFRKDFYKVIDLSIHKVGVKDFLTGKIIKYTSEHQERTLSEENKIEDITLKNPILAVINFIYDANESLLIYEEDRSHIPKETFIERFLDLIKVNSNEGSALIDIVPITNSYRFRERLKEIREIKRVEIKLHPSNPNNQPTWRKYDEKFKRDNITHYREVLENKNAGESIVIDEETTAKIMMGEDGYGVVKASGLGANGESIDIVSTSTEVQAKAIIGSQGNIEEDIEALQEKTLEIKNKSQDLLGDAEVAISND